MIFVPKLHCRVSVTQQAFVKSLSTPEIQPEEQRALQVWTMLPIEYWQNRLREINEGKRKREMIDLIAAQPCLSPAPFTAKCGTLLDGPHFPEPVPLGCSLEPVH